MARKMSVCLFDICGMLLNDRAMCFGFENEQAGHRWTPRVFDHD